MFNAVQCYYEISIFYKKRTIANLFVINMVASSRIANPQLAKMIANFPISKKHNFSHRIYWSNRESIELKSNNRWLVGPTKSQLLYKLNKESYFMHDYIGVSNANAKLEKFGSTSMLSASATAENVGKKKKRLCQ